MTALSDLLFASLPAQLHLGSFLQDPARVHDPVTVENITPHYSRPLADWTRSGCDLVVSGSMLFSGIPAGSLVVALGLWDSHTNGNLLFSWPIAPVHFTKGGTLEVASFTLSLPCLPPSPIGAGKIYLGDSVSSWVAPGGVVNNDLALMVITNGGDPTSSGWTLLHDSFRNGFYYQRMTVWWKRIVDRNAAETLSGPGLLAVTYLTGAGTPYKVQDVPVDYRGAVGVNGQVLTNNALLYGLAADTLSSRGNSLNTTAGWVEEVDFHPYFTNYGVYIQRTAISGNGGTVSNPNGDGLAMMGYVGIIVPAA